MERKNTAAVAAAVASIDADDLWTGSEAARAWGVCRQRVGQFFHEGRIPGAKQIGGRILVPKGVECPTGPRRHPEKRRQYRKGRGATRK